MNKTSGKFAGSAGMQKVSATFAGLSQAIMQGASLAMSLYYMHAINEQLKEINKNIENLLERDADAKLIVLIRRAMNSYEELFLLYDEDTALDVKTAFLTKLDDLEKDCSLELTRAELQINEYLNSKNVMIPSFVFD
jgi:hypothetical protein